MDWNLWGCPFHTQSPSLVTNKPVYLWNAPNSPLLPHPNLFESLFCPLVSPDFKDKYNWVSSAEQWKLIECSLIILPKGSMYNPHFLNLSSTVPLMPIKCSSLYGRIWWSIVSNHDWDLIGQKLRYWDCPFSNAIRRPFGSLTKAVLVDGERERLLRMLRRCSSLTGEKHSRCVSGLEGVPKVPVFKNQLGQLKAESD